MKTKKKKRVFFPLGVLGIGIYYKIVSHDNLTVRSPLCFFVYHYSAQSLFRAIYDLRSRCSFNKYNCGVHFSLPVLLSNFFLLIVDKEAIGSYGTAAGCWPVF